MRIYQCELEIDGRRQVVNLPSEKKIKVGQFIRLEGEEEFRQVKFVYGPFDSSQIKRGWNNNI